MEGTVALRQREGIGSAPKVLPYSGVELSSHSVLGFAHLILYSLILRNKGSGAWCGELKAAWSR